MNCTTAPTIREQLDQANTELKALIEKRGKATTDEEWLTISREVSKVTRRIRNLMESY